MNKILFAITLIFLLSCQKSKENPEVQINIPSEITQVYSDRKDQGLVENVEIDEASGLGLSLSNQNYLWTHNDSGDEARIFLMDNTGKDWGKVTLTGIKNRDWEDMALAKDPVNNKNYIYIADIGDNSLQYSTKFIYRIEEPDIQNINSAININIAKSSVDSIRVKYPETNQDAECLLVDYNGDIYILSKEFSQTTLYRAAFPQSSDIITLEKIGVLPISLVVGGDIQVTGKQILIKTYDKIFLWERPANSTVPAGKYMLQNSPKRLPYTRELQGEAIAWKKDGSYFYTISEEKQGNTTEEAHLYGYEKK